MSFGKVFKYDDIITTGEIDYTTNSIFSVLLQPRPLSFKKKAVENYPSCTQSDKVMITK